MKPLLLPFVFRNITLHLKDVRRISGSLELAVQQLYHILKLHSSPHFYRNPLYFPFVFTSLLLCGFVLCLLFLCVDGRPFSGWSTVVSPHSSAKTPSITVSCTRLFMISCCPSWTTLGTSWQSSLLHFVAMWFILQVWLLSLQRQWYNHDLGLIALTLRLFPPVYTYFTWLLPIFVQSNLTVSVGPRHNFEWLFVLISRCTFLIEVWALPLVRYVCTN